jgi:DMSO/TMAO reductase YedYZ molybdopterin-dependent catalytic subunit
MTLGLMLVGSSTGALCTKFASAADVATTGSSEWKLLVDGSVQHTLDLTLSELAANPKSTVYTELYCYGQLLDRGYWSGVRLRLVLEEAGLDQNAVIVKFHAQDGYEIDLSTSEAMLDNVIIAYEKDGQPLPETLRLVIPGANGKVWISMITQITISTSMTETSSPTPEPPPMPKQSPTPQLPPTPQPNNQSATPPVISPSNNQSVTTPVIPPSISQPEQQQDSPSSSLPPEPGYAALATLSVVIGVTTVHLFLRRKKSSVPMKPAING